MINAKITTPSNLFVAAKSSLMKAIQNELQVQGKLLESGAKTNAGSQGIKDSGGLINTIKATVTNLKVVVGTPKAYGRLNEEGGRITAAQKRAMFAAMKGRPQRPSKGVLSGLQWKARPYLIPAFNERVEDMKKRFAIIVKDASK